MGTMRLVVDGGGRSFPAEVSADQNRLGRIMQRLTAITVIVMVPNFVARIYGMNYVHLFPPSEWKYGFAVVVAFLACMVGWGFFHSRLPRWL
jgi:magnesium transporter